MLRPVAGLAAVELLQVQLHLQQFLQVTLGFLGAAGFEFEVEKIQEGLEIYTGRTCETDTIIIFQLLSIFNFWTEDKNESLQQELL